MTIIRYLLCCACAFKLLSLRLPRGSLLPLPDFYIVVKYEPLHSHKTPQASTGLSQWYVLEMGISVHWKNLEKLAGLKNEKPRNVDGDGDQKIGSESEAPSFFFGDPSTTQESELHSSGFLVD